MVTFNPMVSPQRQHDRISARKGSYQQQNNANTDSLKQAQHVSYGKVPKFNYGEAIVNGLKKEKGISAWFARLLHKNSPDIGGGEVQSILVNATGTGVFAPVVIACNPISNKGTLIFFDPLSQDEKNSRAYSAWRQPLSAILAAIMTITANIWWNQGIENFLATTANPRYSLQHKPPLPYLYRKLKNENTRTEFLKSLSEKLGKPLTLKNLIKECQLKGSPKNKEEWYKIGKKIQEKLEENKIKQEMKKLGFVWNRKKARQTVEKALKHVEHNTKFIKDWGGAAVSIAIGVGSCYILNWIYPRFMEKVFPDLSKRKNSKGGNK